MPPRRAFTPLGRLIKQAAALSPELTFARLGAELGDVQRLAIGELDALADRFVARWRAAGVGEGARAVLITTPEPLALAAIAGATRAGVEVALVSAALDAPALAAGARAVSAAAFVGPANFAGLDLGRRLLEAAAPRSLRVLLWGGDRVGAERLDAAPACAPPGRPAGHEAGLALIAPHARTLDSPRLAAIASDFAEAARIKPNSTILSLISPASPA